MVRRILASPYLWVIIGTGVSNAAWTMALAKLPAGRVSVFQYSVPGWAVIFSWLLLGEPITPLLIIGGIAIISGVAITQRSARPPAHRPEIEAPALGAPANPRTQM